MELGSKRKVIEKSFVIYPDLLLKIDNEDNINTEKEEEEEKKEDYHQQQEIKLLEQLVQQKLDQQQREHLKQQFEKIIQEKRTKILYLTQKVQQQEEYIRNIEREIVFKQQQQFEKIQCLKRECYQQNENLMVKQQEIKKTLELYQYQLSPVINQIGDIYSLYFKWQPKQLCHMEIGESINLDN